MKKWILIVAALLPLAMLTGCEWFIGNLDKKAATVGVIGGADGPTAIFVTTKINWVAVAVAAAAVLLLIVLLVRHFKGKK